MECELETGRTHQIRVHLKFKGASIIGDYQYGKESKKFKKINAEFYRIFKNIKGQFYMLKLLNFNILLKTSGLNLHQNYQKILKKC